MPGLDDITKQLKQNWVELGLIGVALTNNENKAAALAKAVAGIALERLIPVSASLAGALLGVRSVIKAIVQDSGALQSAWERLSRLKLYQDQLQPLVKSAAAAKQRLSELMDVANRTRFPLGSVVAGSRALEIFTKGVEGGTESMRLMNAIARSSGSGIDTASEAFGGMYRSMRDGQPVKQAAQEMINMGVVSEQTADQIQRMQDGGAGFSQTFGAMKAAIAANTSSSDDFADSVEGLQKRLESAQAEESAAFGEPFLKSQQEAMQNSIAIATNLAPVMAALGKTLSAVVTVADNLGSGFMAVATAIPGLATVVGFVTKMFVGLATGISALGLYRLIGSVGGAVNAAREMVASFSLASVATDLLAKKTALLAEAQTVEAAEGAGAAVAQRAFAGACAIGAAGANVAAGAVSRLTAWMRGLMASLLTNPITLWIAGVVLLVGGLWQWRERTEENAKALADLKAAGDDMVHSLDRQIAAMKSLDDAHQAMIDSTNQLAEARKKLRELEDSHAPTEQKNAQKAVINSLKDRQEQIRQQRAAGKLAPGGEQEQVLRTQAQREIAIQDASKQNAIDLASGPARLALMRGRLMDQIDRSQQGAGLATARAKLHSDSEPLDEQIGGLRARAADFAEQLHGSGVAGEAVGGTIAEKIASLQGKRGAVTGVHGELGGSGGDEQRAKYDTAIAALQKQQHIEEEIARIDEQKNQLARDSASEIIQEEQKITDLVKSGAITEKEAAERRRAVLTRRIDLEENQPAHAQAAVQQGAAMVQETRQQAAANIGVEAAEKEAALRSEGYARAVEESSLRMQTIEAERRQMESEGKTVDSPEMKGLDARAAAERQSMELLERKAAIERAMDAAHLKVLAAENEALKLATEGRFSEAAEARKRGIAESDQIQYNESIRSKMESGHFTTEQAHASALAEQRQREAEREAKTNAFRSEKGRELTERELAVSGRGRNALTHLHDEDTVRGHLKEGIEGGLAGNELREYALRASRVGLQEQAGEISRGSVVASSLGKIGGGGGVYGVDGMKELARRQADLLQIIADNTRPSPTEGGMQ